MGEEEADPSEGSGLGSRHRRRAWVPVASVSPFVKWEDASLALLTRQQMPLKRVEIEPSTCPGTRRLEPCMDARIMLTGGVDHAAWGAPAEHPAFQGERYGRARAITRKGG